MSNIQTQTVQRAAAMLAASGAKFRIIYEDLSLGDLEVVPPSTRAKRGTYLTDERKDAVASMRVGDVRTFEADPEELDQVRNSVSAYAINRWGAGCITASIKTGKVEMMRIQ